MVKKIIVEGNTLLEQAEIDAIILPNEGKSLGLEELTMIAELITARYREKLRFFMVWLQRRGGASPASERPSRYPN